MTSAWDEWPDTLIEVDAATGREVQRVNLSQTLRIRYWAKRLRPAAPTELKAGAPEPELSPATDFGGL